MDSMGNPRAEPAMVWICPIPTASQHKGLLLCSFFPHTHHCLGAHVDLAAADDLGDVARVVWL